MSFALSFASPPPLPVFAPLKFHPPQPERVVLSNGLVLLLLEDHELPLLHIQMMFRAGQEFDPPEKLGRASLFGPVMTQGGSAAYAPEVIQRALDETGGGISFSAGLESASGGLSCQAKDLDKLWPLFVDLLRHPQFRGDYLDIERARALEELRRRNDEPAEIGRREFRKVILGKSHPYARTPDPASLQRVQRKDLLELHKTYFIPNTSWLAVSGDFKSAEMKERIQKALGDWARAPEAPRPAAPEVAPLERHVYYIQRPLAQSQIRIGHIGMARHNPDHFAWEVFNELWGHSGTSLLFRIVRTQKGLAYSVMSAFSEFRDPGLIVAICQTRAPETPQAIQAMMELTQHAASVPFTDTEISSAKESIRNRFVENFASSAQIVEQIMTLDYFGFPPDYLDTYPDRIGQVSRQDLLRAAQLHLHPDRASILVVGDLSTFDKPLSLFGKPQEIKPEDYTQQP